MDERVYVYAIAAASSRAPENSTGFGGPLYIIPYGELAAVVSQIGGADTAESGNAVPAATAENLLRHEAVVEAVRAGGPALPVRFGTALANSDEVTRALARHYEALRGDVRRIGDKVEIGVSVLWHSAKAAAGTHAADAGEQRTAGGEDVDRGPGLAYLRARQMAFRQAEVVRERAQALAREVDIALRPLALEWRRSLCPSDRLALRDQYLVERERVTAFEGAFEEVRRRHQEARFLLSGPWPPYSFVTPLGRRDEETSNLEQTGAGGTDEAERIHGAFGV